MRKQGLPSFVSSPLAFQGSCGLLRAFSRPVAAWTDLRVRSRVWGKFGRLVVGAAGLVEFQQRFVLLRKFVLA